MCVALFSARIRQPEQLSVYLFVLRVYVYVCVSVCVRARVSCKPLHTYSPTSSLRSRFSALFRPGPHSEVLTRPGPATRRRRPYSAVPLLPSAGPPPLGRHSCDDLYPRLVCYPRARARTCCRYLHL